MGIVFFLLGVVAGGAAVIVFGKNNKKKIEAARAELIGLYNKVDPAIKDQLKNVEQALIGRKN